MKTSLFEVQNLVLRPIFALAHDFDDAANLLSDSLTRGMGMRPDADFDIVMRKLVKGSPEHLLEDWCKQGKRGFVWPVGEERNWELTEFVGHLF